MDKKTELQKRFEEQTPTIKGISQVEYLQLFISWLHLQVERLQEKKLPAHSALVADIRNKLSSPKNLCAMLQDREVEPFIEQELNDMVTKEIEQTLKSIDYLSNL